MTAADVKQYSNISKTETLLNEMNARLVVLENSLIGGDDMLNVNPIKYCTSNFPKERIAMIV